MRLRRLDLTRYGRFTGRSLDFGQPSPGTPDLHIIYGPNEAGKSTALAAYMDLLFGIGAQSSYNFLHDYRAMEVGGVFETGDDALALIRTKGNKDTLRDDRDRVVDQARLSAMLHGLDRDEYGARFALDRGRLEQGGAEILASRGELGRTLFSAASGLANATEALETLAARAGAFFKPRATKTELNALLKEIKALEDERKRLDTHAAEYERLRDEQAIAAGHLDKVKQERDTLETRKDTLERIRSAFPIAEALARVQARDDALAAYPAFDDPALKAEVAAMQASSIEARTQAATAAEQIKAKDVALGDIAEDAEGAALADGLADLDGLRDGFRSGRRDIDRVRAELTEQEDLIADLIKRLGFGAEYRAADLVQPPGRIAALADLHAAYAGVTARVEGAKAEAEAAAKTLEQARGAAPSPEDEGPDTQALETLVRQIRAADPAGAVERAEAALLRATAEGERALVRLEPWTGTLDALLRGSAPSVDQATGWRDAGRRIEDALAERRKRRADVGTDLTRLEAEIARMTGEEGIVSDAGVTAARTRRDQLWQAHRTSLTDATADAFETALHADDAAQAARLSKSDRLASLYEKDQTAAAHRAEISALEAAETALLAERAELAEAMRGPLTAAGLPEDMTAAALPGWLDRRSTAMGLAEKVAAAMDERGIAEQALEREALALRAALEAVGETVPAARSVEAMLDQGDGWLGRAREERQQRAARSKALAEAERAHADRVEARDKALDDFRDWTAQWEAAVAESWLKDRAPADVAACLEPLRALSAALVIRDDKVRRISGMERDIRAFETALADLDPTPAGERDTDTRYGDLAARVADARKAEDDRKTLTGAREALAEDARGAAAKTQVLSARVAEIAGRYPEALGIDGLDALAGALEKSAERAALAEQRAEQEAALQSALHCASLGEAKAALGETTLAEVEADLVAVRSTLGLSEGGWQDAIAAQREAEVALRNVGGDATVARIEEDRAALLLDISQRAEMHLRLSLGVMAAERALHLFRDRHRSAMMARTGQAFGTLTGAAYSKLVTVAADGGERLIAHRTDSDATLGVEAMSDGTRHQLYLALRIAGYEDFCGKAGPLPLVADDILESFDEDRSAAAFAELLTIARHGQAIYLTHHRHLCSIAKDVCGDGVRIHDL